MEHYFGKLKREGDEEIGCWLRLHRKNSETFVFIRVRSPYSSTDGSVMKINDFKYKVLR